MAIRTYINNFSTKLDGAILVSDTSILVDDGAPISAALTGNNYIVLTLDDYVHKEIVYCTAASINTLTITRAQEGTTAIAFADNSKVECRHTKFSYKDPEWKLISANVLGSNVANVDFTNLSGSYRIEIVNYKSSAGDLSVRCGFSGSADTGAHYSYIFTHISSQNTGISFFANTGQTSIRVSANADSSNPLSGDIFIHDTTYTGYNHIQTDLLCTTFSSPTRHSQRMTCAGAWIDNTHAVDMVRLFTATGNILTGTKFYLYKRILP